MLEKKIFNKKNLALFSLGLHFLVQGLVENQDSLYVTFGEPAEQIKANGTAIGLNMDAIHFLDLSPSSD
ncbi:MAG: hypothetical protein Kow0049_27690 [Stanieria sp.]